MIMVKRQECIYSICALVIIYFGTTFLVDRPFHHRFEKLLRNEEEKTKQKSNSSKATEKTKRVEYNNRGEEIGQISRAFTLWSGRSDAWCTNRDTYSKKKPTGLFYVKVPKTASTTSASVNLQIAHRHGTKHGYRDDKCMDFHEHVTATNRGLGRRDKANSLLWTTLREPTKRSMSFVFFAKVSRQEKLEPTDENIIKTLRDLEDDFQLNYIRTRDLPWKSNAKDKDKVASIAVKNVIEDYDFIALTERMDESFIAMKHLLNLDFGDIMYVSAKISGGWDGGRSEYGCMRIVPTFVSEGVGKFLESDEWQNKNSADFLLYEAANRSLDKTIAQFDKDEFEKELEEYRSLLKSVQSVCEKKTIWRCAEDGTFSKYEAEKNCYTHDEGCGYPCIDEYIRLYEEEKMSLSEVEERMSIWELG